MIPDNEKYLSKKPGYKILIDAASVGNLDLIRQQVEKGVDIDTIDFTAAPLYARRLQTIRSNRPSCSLSWEPTWTRQKT